MFRPRPRPGFTLIAGWVAERRVSPGAMFEHSHPQSDGEMVKRYATGAVCTPISENGRIVLRAKEQVEKADGEEELDGGEELSVGLVIPSALDLIEQKRFDLGFANAVDRPDMLEEEPCVENVVASCGRPKLSENEILFNPIEEGLQVGTRRDGILLVRLGDQE